MANLLESIVDIVTSEDAFILMLTNLKGVVSPEVLFFIAQVGKGVGPEIYETIPEDMKRAPTSLKEAYAQAYFYTVLAIRRGVRLEDENLAMPGTTQVLFRHFTKLVEESKTVDKGVSALCDRAGLGCPVQSPKQVLLSTMRAIEASKLPAEDTKKIVGLIRHNRNMLMLNRAVPWVLLLGAVGLATSATTAGGAYAAYLYRKGSE